VSVKKTGSVSAKRKSLAVRLVPIEDLVPDAHNPNLGTARGRAFVETSLKKFGAGRSILIDRKGQVIAGNKTLEAARRAGFKKVAVIQTDGDTVIAVGRTDLDLEKDEKAKELAIADNRSSELGLDWDPETLKARDVDLAQFWNEAELERLMGTGAEEEAPEARIDEAEELRKKWKTARGQLWTAGKHRILCGDATELKEVKRLFANGESASLVVTDPPYGVSYESTATGTILNDEKRDDALLQMLVGALKAMSRCTLPNAAFYIWHASSTRRDFEIAMDRAGLLEKQCIIWAKDSFVLGRADYHWQAEPCFYAEKAGGGHAPFYGERDQSTVWRIGYRDGKGARVVSLAGGLRISNGEGIELFLAAKSPRGKKFRLLRVTPGDEIVATVDSRAGDQWAISHERGVNLHPTQKPTALAMRAIVNSSKPGEIVLDSFLGGGVRGAGGRGDRAPMLRRRARSEVCGRHARAPGRDGS